MFLYVFAMQKYNNFWNRQELCRFFDRPIELSGFSGQRCRSSLGQPSVLVVETDVNVDVGYAVFLQLNYLLDEQTRNSCGLPLGLIHHLLSVFTLLFRALPVVKSPPIAA